MADKTCDNCKRHGNNCTHQEIPQYKVCDSWTPVEQIYSESEYIYTYVDLDWKNIKIILIASGKTDEEISKVAKDYREILIKKYPNSKEYIERWVN